MTKYYCTHCKQFWKDGSTDDYRPTFDYWVYCTSWGIEKKLCPPCMSKELERDKKKGEKNESGN